MVLLIGGHQRSGTTLLYNLCDRHPDMTLTLEFGNFIDVGNPYAVHRRRMFGRWWDLRFRPLYSTFGHRPWSLARNLFVIVRYLLKVYQFGEQRLSARVIEAGLRSLSPNARIVGDKYPDYVFLLEKLTRENGLLPLIIYRDCRDVVGSTLQKARTEWRNKPFVKKTDTAEKAAKRWVWAIECMTAYAGRLHSMCYEALVRDPKPHLEALGRWLGVDPEGFPGDIIVDTHMGNFSDRLTPEELQTVMDIAGSTMARLGYL